MVNEKILGKEMAIVKSGKGKKIVIDIDSRRGEAS